MNFKLRGEIYSIVTSVIIKTPTKNCPSTRSARNRSRRHAFLKNDGFMSMKTAIMLSKATNCEQKVVIRDLHHGVQLYTPPFV